MSPTPSDMSEMFSTVDFGDFGSSVLLTQTPAPSPSVSAPHPIAIRIPTSHPTPPPHPQATSTSVTEARPAPSSGQSGAPRSKKKRASNLNTFESLLSTLDQRAAARDALMEAGRQRRNDIIESVMGLGDECGRLGQRVAKFMRSLPPNHLADFKVGLQNLMDKTKEEVVKEQEERAIFNEL